MYDELMPMNVAQMMDRAVDAYKKSFWKQIGYSAIVSVIFFAAAFIVGIVVAITAAFAGMFDGADPRFGVIILLVIIFLPLVLLWLGFSSAGHILFTREALFGHMLTLPRLKLHVMALRAISALFAQMLVFLPIIGLLFFMFWGSFIIFVENLLFVNFTTMGFVFVLIVSLIISVIFMLIENMFSLSITAAMFEGRLFFGALTRSFELIRGDFFKIFATRLLWYLVAFGFVMAAQGLSALFALIAGILVGTVNPALSIILLPIGFFVSIFSLVVSFAQMPMDGIMRAIVYFNQRIKKDGLDIELRLVMMWQKRPPK